MKYPIFKVKFLLEKSHRRKARNGSFDSSRKALSYWAVKKFPVFVADHLKSQCSFFGNFGNCNALFKEL